MKNIKGVYTNPNGHWVGDGFPVRSLFFYGNFGKILSPFLLLDYAGPAEFPPTNAKRGVGSHPHRGFETVTIVYHGEVAHKDSTGNGGIIGPGDVQWMTAGSGILHEEFHSESFSRSGGKLEMVQLWVNLPSKHKMATPGYQHITNASIPDLELPGGGGSVRIIAGEYQSGRGPANTFSPMNVWDLRLKEGRSTILPIPETWNTALVVLHGSLKINHSTIVRDAEFVVLDTNGTEILVEPQENTTALLLSGEPIQEPIVGYGPFVMNTEREIQDAFRDFQSGRFGIL